MSTAAADQPERRALLHVMKISHYCERARWGLDRAGIAYEERAWAPGPHTLLARRLKVADTSVPILVSGARVVQGSGAILSWAGLGEGDPAVERRFEAIVAPLVRQYVYAGTLHDPASGVRALLLEDVGPVQAAVARAGWPMIRRAMTRMMDIRAELLPDLERRLDRELDWADALVDGVLADGFGRTGITAASLLAPLAQPDAMPLYRQLRLPAAMQRAFERWQRRPSLQWVRGAYVRHRG